MEMKPCSNCHGLNVGLSQVQYLGHQSPSGKWAGMCFDCKQSNAVRDDPIRALEAWNLGCDVAETGMARLDALRASRAPNAIAQGREPQAKRPTGAES